MSHTFRATFPALFLSLIVPCALPAMAADPAPGQDAGAQAVERAALPSRSQEDEIALERQLPKQDLQQLQAGDENFLALWKPANTEEPQGAVIILPGAGESPDWPDAVGPLRRKFPDTGWATLSISLPDAQDPALLPREPDAAPADAKAEKPKDEAAKDVSAEAQASADTAKAAADEERDKAQAEKVFARIESAISFAQQNKARTIVLLGHSSGAYWAAKFISERPSPLVQKLVMVAAREPAGATQSLLDLVPGLKIKTADFVYKNQAQQAALERLQASKRAKGPGFTQIALINIVGNEETEQEQMFRRIRGWVEAQ
ncbi:alpha/beta hydrolase family protein [Pseudomonas sp. CDFA 602]|uniref:alpha/beta hydrolase family protein n=1 Tax=Pseudomonas californiensis TaxID=2829823 RepID=UPI001E3E5159|nr:alpha/beta hydrolase family protein [Pseudomonas californiensis]MCD5995244.1 alpha/beta hydrolase family protein [Pseudomonas californiensis]MCD6000925.1 alpha/beta hydrolase family protein [Pseudomonas californiensis]